LADVTVGNGTVTSLDGSGADYTFTVVPSGDGAVTVEVRGGAAHDAAGNANTPGHLSRTFDRTSPSIAFASAPAASTTSAAAVLAFSVDEEAVVTCSFDGAPFGACASPVSLLGLAPGSHT